MDVRIHDLLARTALVQPNRIGATLGDDARTFAELDAGANRAAHRLTAEGIAPHDRVVWWGPTALDALELGYGISKAGAVLAPINPNFTEPEAVSALETLKPRLVVAHPDSEGAARAAAEPLGLPILVTHDGWHAGASSIAPRASARLRTRASSSSPAAPPGCRRVRCSRTAPRGCAASNATTRAALPNGAAWS